MVHDKLGSLYNGTCVSSILGLIFFGNTVQKSFSCLLMVSSVLDMLNVSSIIKSTPSISTTVFAEQRIFQIAFSLVFSPHCQINIMIPGTFKTFYPAV